MVLGRRGAAALKALRRLQNPSWSDVRRPSVVLHSGQPRCGRGSITAEVVVVVDVLQDKREAIAGLCAKHGVVRLDVFGSALRDDFRPGESDVDLLVEFGPMDGYAKAVAYFDLLDELRELLGVEVDLVMTGAVKNRFIARDIERTRQLLYAA